MPEHEIIWSSQNIDPHKQVGVYKGVPVSVQLHPIDQTWFITYNDRSIKRGFPDFDDAVEWLQGYLSGMEEMFNIS